MSAPYLRLVRPGNVAMSAVAVGIGGVVGAGAAIPAAALSLGWAALAAALFAAAGNVLNDYFDRETDRVNHPDRPIPSGQVGAVEAGRFAATLFVVSAAALGGSGMAAVALFSIWWLNLAAMVSYERLFKGRGLPGNLLIGYLVGSLFLFGGAASSSFVGTQAILRTGVLALLAAVTTLGREIVKDVQDVTGDTDRVTLPKRIGIRAAAATASACFLLGVALSVLPVAWGLLGFGYVVVLAADGIFIYAALVSAKRPGVSQQAAKYGMLAALAAFLLGGLT